MSIAVLKLGANDQGRRMALADFEDAETEEGCILELSRGIIVVSQMPNPRHFYIEIVSPGSEERDYVLKREEYLEFGVKEYWILDPERREMLVHRRGRKGWKEETVTPPDKYDCRVLPGLEFDCGAVFRAAGEVG